MDILLSRITKNKKQLRSYFIKAILVSLSAAALLGIVALLSGSFGELELRILFTTFIFGIVSILCLSCSTSLGKRHQAIGAVGILASLTALISALIIIWISAEYSNYEILYKVLLVGIIIGFACSHISLLLQLVGNTSTYVRYSLAATVGAIIVIAVMLILLVINQNFLEYAAELYWRLLGVFAILDVLGSVVTPSLAKFISQK